jgi:hypothetical protein
MRHDDAKHGDVPQNHMPQNGIPENPGRRSLLGAIARLPVLLAAAYAGIFPRFAAAQKASGEEPVNEEPATQELGQHELAVLERFGWLLFPIPDLGMSPYQRVASGIAAAVHAQPAQFTLVREGIEQLDAKAGGSFLDLPEPAQVGQLRHIETGDFFQFVYAAVRGRLFDDREVWALLGYEGSSLEKGGYLNRGLNDIDWL